MVSWCLFVKQVGWLESVCLRSTLWLRRALVIAAALVVGACAGSSTTIEEDCASYIATTIAPELNAYAPGQFVRFQGQLYNCGKSNWLGYSVIRTEGTIGPAAMTVGDWPPGTRGAIWFEGPVPTARGLYRPAFELTNDRVLLARVWGVIRVGAAPGRK
jgi:hypothetical protein